MRLHETSIFIFIAALVLGLLISLNIDIPGRALGISLSAQQYQEAYNNREKLYKEILTLKETYNANKEKLDRYKNSDNASIKILSDISSELRDNSMLVGDTEVIGEGVRITIKDGDIGRAQRILEDPSYTLVHDSDILFIIKVLRNAGAKAISVNGLRVINTSNFICSGAFISVDGVKAAEPFIIDVIGNKDTIQNYLNTEEPFLLFMQEVRKVDVRIETVNEIKIPAYLVDIKYKYMTE